ncbi:MAG: DUF2721 domain-containing protein [Rhodocyclaceae bacterium]|nr:DUF2721 domain-containing protein [Rhodocyclaceae bacterium]MBP6279225.1 DUF2721 domain-containing protein [Rhodocyclaceae bacterium]
MQTHFSDISQVIQLAIAPVFLLTAVATMINAMNTRLGRVVDRRRVIQDRLDATQGESHPECDTEMEQLRARSRLIYFAMFGAVLAALLVCLVVAGSFLGALLEIEISREIAGLFIAAMLAMIGALSLFLREVYLAVITGAHNRR